MFSRNINNQKTNKTELLPLYQKEVEESRKRKIQDKSNKITEERQQMKQVNDQLEQESQTRIENKQNFVNAQRQDYEKYISEKVTRQKSGDFRKKRSEPQGTFKIGGENREIKRKLKDDFESELPLNPTRNVHIPTQPGSNQKDDVLYENIESNVESNANIMQQNRNRSQGYNIISGQASQVAKAADQMRNDNYNSNNINGQMKPETPKIKYNIQTQANNASYNPISHTDNSNYYSNSVNTNANQRTNANAGRATGNNRNFNIVNNNDFDDESSKYKNRKNSNVASNNNYNNNNKFGQNLQNEEEYENIVSAQANKDYRVQESEGNEYDQAEKYAELSDEEKRKLYEEYMRKYGAQHENEEDIYNNHKEYEKENEVINF